MTITEEIIKDYEEKANIMASQSNHDGILFLLETLLNPNNIICDDANIGTIVLECAPEFEMLSKDDERIIKFLNLLDSFMSKNLENIKDYIIQNLLIAKIVLCKYIGHDYTEAFTKAIEYSDRIIEKDPLYVHSYYKKVNIYNIEGNHSDEAKKILEKMEFIITNESEERLYQKAYSCWKEKDYLLPRFDYCFD